MKSFLAAAAVGMANAQYQYMPVEFAYGSNSRVTANMTFGTASGAHTTKVVMDTGSANFWVGSSFFLTHLRAALRARSVSFEGITS
jgi:hypothetical protein